MRVVTTLIGLGVVAVACGGGEAREATDPASAATDSTVVVANLGTQEMEGHTPRGFAGSGTGLFVGDNLNPAFPNGDGVQTFLTFDLHGIDSTSRALLVAGNSEIEGQPFGDLGVLEAFPVRFDRFGPELWNIEPIGPACQLAVAPDDPISCDVTDAVGSALASGAPHVQFVLRFVSPSDSDGSQDMVFFFASDPNVNEPGLFELRVETR